MAGTIAGGKAAAATNKRAHGPNFYGAIGAMGGRAKVPKGFAVMDKAKVRAAGRKGGMISRKTRAKKAKFYEGPMVSSGWHTDAIDTMFTKPKKRSFWERLFGL